MSTITDINGALKKAGAAFRLLKTGGSRGEWLITKFVDRHRVTNFLSVLKFLGVPPWVAEKTLGSVQEHIMLESQDTAVVITIVNGKYVVATQQHRPIFSRWFIETERGWRQKEGGATEILRRKLPYLLGDNQRGIKGIAEKDVKIVTLLPSIAEDTGLRTNDITYYICYATCEIPSIEGQDERKTLRNLLTEVGNDIYRVFVYTVEELDNHLVELMVKQNPSSNRGFIEAISISAWTAFFFYREKVLRTIESAL